MKSLRKLLTLAFILSILTVIGLSPAAAMAAPAPMVETQLGMVLDGSGSIAAADFQIMKDGLAAAVQDADVMPQDGRVELTIVQFGGYSVGDANVELAPTVVNSTNMPAILAAITGMTQRGGGTPMASGIDLAVAAITGSANFSVATWQVINVSTDGQPNVGSPDGKTAAQNSVAAGVAAGIDELDAEAVGSGPDVTWMVNSLVFPSPGVIAPPFPPRSPDAGFTGFVILCADYSEYVDALGAKFDVILPPTNVPGISSLGIIAAVAVIGTTGLLLLRRREVHQTQ